MPHLACWRQLRLLILGHERILNAHLARAYLLRLTALHQLVHICYAPQHDYIPGPGRQRDGCRLICCQWPLELVRPSIAHPFLCHLSADHPKKPENALCLHSCSRLLTRDRATLVDTGLHSLHPKRMTPLFNCISSVDEAGDAATRIHECRTCVWLPVSQSAAHLLNSWTFPLPSGSPTLRQL